MDLLPHWPPWSILNLDLAAESNSGKNALWFIDNPLDLWMSYIQQWKWHETEESCGKKVWEKRREGMLYYTFGYISSSQTCFTINQKADQQMSMKQWSGDIKCNDEFLTIYSPSAFIASMVAWAITNYSTPTWRRLISVFSLLIIASIKCYKIHEKNHTWIHRVSAQQAFFFLNHWYMLNYKIHLDGTFVCVWFKHLTLHIILPVHNTSCTQLLTVLSYN